MITNKWYVDENNLNEVVIRRLEDDISILQMSSEKLNREEMIDVAKQIVDDWNFDCEELE